MLQLVRQVAPLLFFIIAGSCMGKEEKIRFWIGQVTLIQFFYAVCVGVVLIFCEKILAKYLSNMPSVMLGGYRISTICGYF